MARKAEETVTKALILSAHRLMDRRITAEANALVESGRSVTLVCLPVCLAQAGLDARVRVCMAEGSPASSGMAIAPPRKWITLCQRVLPYPAYRLAARLRYHDFHRAYFFRHIPAEAFDAIHCHDLEILPTAIAWREGNRGPARLIYDAHELTPHEFTIRNVRRYWSAVERKHIGQADAVIAVNESVARELERTYAVAPPEVILNSCGVGSGGAAIDRQAFLAHFGAPADGFKVLYVGGLLRGRNLDSLVDAFGLLPEGCKLFLLGEGPEEARLRQRCKARALPNVFFGTWPGQDRVLSYAAHGDLGVIPYRENGLLNNRYCTPNKLFEFIEAEQPICASDLPELRRFVRDEGIGGVYPMDSPGAIAEAVADCRRRCERGEFPQSTRRAAREKFSWPRQAQKLVALYERLGV